MHELCYTSLPRGLAAGTSGYATVAQTPGIGRSSALLAEGLSFYAPLNETNPLEYASEPVNWFHLILESGLHVVSRISACAPDHTNRSNFLAHHLLLEPGEIKPCRGGPAELLAEPGLLMTEWMGEARHLQPRVIPAIADVRPTTSGVEVAGLGAGWAEALADRLRDRSVEETWLVYPLGMDMLGVMRSVLSHLTAEERWAATFTTLASKTFPGRTAARVKCVVAGTDYAAATLGKKGVFDLSKPSQPPERRHVAAVPYTRGSGAGHAFPRPPVKPTSQGVAYGNIGGGNSDGARPGAVLPMPPPIEQPSGYPGWAVAVPTLVALAMTLAAAWAGFEWLKARKSLEDKAKSFASLEKDSEALEKNTLEIKSQTDLTIKSQIDEIAMLKSQAAIVVNEANDLRDAKQKLQNEMSGKDEQLRALEEEIKRLKAENKKTQVPSDLGMNVKRQPADEPGAAAEKSPEKLLDYRLDVVSEDPNKMQELSWNNRQSKFQLFSNKTHHQLFSEKMLKAINDNDGKKLYEKLEFGQDAKVLSEPAYDDKGSPCFTIVDRKTGAGVLLGRANNKKIGDSGSQPEVFYAVVGIALSDNDHKTLQKVQPKVSRWMFTKEIEDMDKKKRNSSPSLDSDNMKSSKNDFRAHWQSGKDNSKVSLDLLRDVSFRLTLCEPLNPDDPSKGLKPDGVVVVDSLKKNENSPDGDGK